MRQSNRQSNLPLLTVPNSLNELLGTLDPSVIGTGLGINNGNTLILAIDNTAGGAQALAVDILTQPNFGGPWGVLYAALAYPAGAVTVFERTVNGFAVRARASVGAVAPWPIVVDAGIGAGI